jgi:hypothetical protein
VLAGEDFDIHHDAALAMRYAQRGIAHIACFFAEDGAKQALLRRQLGLALGSDFANEDIAAAHFRAGTDDAALVELRQCVFADVPGCRG